MTPPLNPGNASPLVFGDTRQRICCRPGEPVRLHHLGCILPASNSLLSGPDRHALLLDALKRQCTPWDRTLLRLVERYFAYLRRRLADSLREIEQRLAHYEALYRPEDTLFSAPALLPRTRVKAGGLDDVPIAAAIWSGDRLTALFEGRVAHTPKSARERTGRLEAAGITIALIAPETSAAGDDAFFDAMLGPKHSRFFRTEALPCAPMPPDLAPAFLTTRLHSNDITGEAV